MMGDDCRDIDESSPTQSTVNAEDFTNRIFASVCWNQIALADAASDMAKPTELYDRAGRSCFSRRSEIRERVALASNFGTW